MPAIKILEVLGEGVGYETGAPLHRRRCIGEDGRKGQVGVTLRQSYEMVDEIEIAFAAHAEIHMDWLLHALCNSRVNDPFDRRKARATSNA